MRREDDRVEALQRVDGCIRRSELGVRGRNERCDHTRGLRILDDALRRILLDDAGALLSKRVTQYTQDLGALGVAPLRISETALGDTHRDDAAEGLLVGGCP